ncbi:MAG: Rrf2 family transcriptional regulator [Clostridia bacterium]|nr:Rrf2 family transcriptional regulator [Clostridia bacterium]MBQ6868300.1 Rrf2 family transcriptional regulator [Clostridia bacterium]MBQ7094053.1 Rrf2 family transcriptional regulator [Clostridia bacterium]
MKITREADYAIRILYIIKNESGVVSAREISEKTGVSLRFSLKILAKLSEAGFVDSKKGAQGGYFLKKNADEISLRDIIENIDGPIAISHCMTEDFCCTRVDDKSTCSFRKVFCTVSSKIREELGGLKLSQF